MEQLANKESLTSREDLDEKESKINTSSGLAFSAPSFDCDHIPIYIKDSHNTIILQVQPILTTVANIKQMIKEKHDSHPEKQCLVLNGEILVDSLTLQGYNNQSDITIELHFDSENERQNMNEAPKIMDLTILYLGKAERLTVISTNKIKDLKTTISKLLRLDITKIALVSRWSQCRVLLEEDKTLMDYGIANAGDLSIEVISASEGKLAFFVDKIDNKGIPDRFKKLEEKGISCVLCTSTNEALEVIVRNPWLIKKDKLRIITNLVRRENGKDNFIAGIQFVNHLRKGFNYNTKVMIFCGDLKKAQESCEKEKFKGDYLLSNLDKDLMDFLNF